MRGLSGGGAEQGDVENAEAVGLDDDGGAAERVAGRAPARTRDLGQVDDTDRVRGDEGQGARS